MQHQLRLATRLLLPVTRDLEALLPAAHRDGSVRIDEPQLEAWLATLHTALAHLQSLPISPHPTLSLIDGAKDRLTRAITTLESIPVRLPKIDLPLPAWATIRRQPLEAILTDLQQALAFLTRLLQAA